MIIYQPRTTPVKNNQMISILDCFPTFATELLFNLQHSKHWQHREKPNEAFQVITARAVVCIEKIQPVRDSKSLLVQRNHHPQRKEISPSPPLILVLFIFNVHWYCTLKQLTRPSWKKWQICTDVASSPALFRGHGFDVVQHALMAKAINLGTALSQRTQFNSNF